MENTILKIPHNKCTGCGACANACPKNAITMELDAEGFLFPKVNEELCIDCGKCRKVCPVEHPVSHHPAPKSYAVWAKDSVRKESSSGGMFTLMADWVLEQGGVVFGARYAPDYQSVYHAAARNQEELLPLKKSKYVQSDTGLTYREAKKALDGGQYVLYTGCPCQIAGLYNYLGKDYDKLITADLVCHGANSTTAYQSFLKEFSEGKPIEKVDFRDKVYYNWATPAVVYLKDGTVKKKPSWESSWYEGFLKGMINRWNCSTCPYARPQRIADITLADAWQIQKINPAYDDKKGTSLVLINSPRGQELFSRVKRNMELCERIPFDEIRRYNGQINAPQKSHRFRKYFFQYMDKYGYEDAVKMVQGRKAPYDIGYLGWWESTNYGSVLTSFAINRTLKGLGKSVLMLEYPRMVKDLPEGKRYGVEFANALYDVSDITYNDDFQRFNCLCNAFLVGSDQLWNYNNNKNFGVDYFFANFADNPKKKIAYATSFGMDHENYPDGAKIRVGYYLSKFDAISVREESGVDICRNSFNVEATHVLDPVFLCSKEAYQEAIDLSKLDLTGEKYVLSYLLDVTEDKLAAVRGTAEKLGLPYRIILDGQKDVEKIKAEVGDPNIVNPIRIEDWLNYFAHAQYVVTDSFHGFCYSIIFHKPMSVFANRHRGMARFDTICKLTDLQNRLVFNLEELKERKLTEQPVDFREIDNKLQPMKDFSMAWLVNALEKPKLPISVRELQLWKCLEHDRRIHNEETEVAALRKQVSELKQQLTALQESGRISGQKKTGKFHAVVQSIRNNGFKYTWIQFLKKVKRKYSK